MTSAPAHLQPNQDGAVPVLFRATGPASQPSVVAVLPLHPADGEGQLTRAYHLTRDGLTLTAVRGDYVGRSRPATVEERAALAQAMAETGAKFRAIQRVSEEAREVFRCRALALRANSLGYEET